MRSSLPKVLHQVAGRSLLEHVLRAAAPLKADKTVVVVGHGSSQVKEWFAGAAVEFVEQLEQLGTGHALLQTQGALQGFSGSLLVLNGDMPLITSASLQALMKAKRDTQAGMALVTCEVDEASGLGRVIREADGRVVRIVEDKDASESEKRVREINPGVYLFDEMVFELAQQLGNDNAAGEYYITDLIDLYMQAGKRVQAVKDDYGLGQQVGVNTREQLAVADRILRDRVRQRWLEAGVSMVAPEQIFIDDTVVLEPDVTLYPGVWLTGETSVGEGASIGPYSYLHNCTVSKRVRVAPHTVREDVIITAG